MVGFYPLHVSFGGVNQIMLQFDVFGPPPKIIVTVEFVKVS